MSELPTEQDRRMNALEERIALLEFITHNLKPSTEERLKVLEAFHHWATTQKFIQLEERIAKLEPQSVQWQQHPFDPGASRQQQSFPATEQERLMQPYQHIANHPPFTQSQSMRYPDDGTLDPNRSSDRMPDYEFPIGDAKIARDKAKREPVINRPTEYVQIDETKISELKREPGEQDKSKA